MLWGESIDGPVKGKEVKKKKVQTSAEEGPKMVRAKKSQTHQTRER
jgi:hypothetical protein